MIEHAALTSKCVTYRLLQTCIAKKDLILGREAHTLLVSYGYDLQNTYSSQLIRFYAAIGQLREAFLAFNQVSGPNLCAWSAIVAAHAKVGDATQTLRLYEKMLQCGVKPNKDVFLCMLKACSSEGLISISQAIDLIKQQGIPLSNNLLYSLLQGCLKARNVAAIEELLELVKIKGLDCFGVLGDQLIRVFAVCGGLQEANDVFEMIAKPSVHTWNAIISAHVALGQSERAFSLFCRMQKGTMEPNEFILSCTLKACGAMGSLRLGMLVHWLVVLCQMESDVTVGNALIDLYAKCGDLEGACNIFEGLPRRDVVSWGSMAVGLSQHGKDLSVVELYKDMEKGGGKANRVVFLHVVKACGNIGALGYGRLVHGQILKQGLQQDALVGSALIDMYATCGSLDDLRRVFDQLPTHDAISWGAMIGGYLQHGNYASAATCLEDMQGEGFKPDAVIFTSVLTACSQAGLLDKGFCHFKTMTEKCGGVSPSTTQYNCLIDLLSRTGCLDEADALFHTMPALPDYIGLKSLLTSCKTHTNVGLGAQCFDASVRCDLHDSAGFILMSNIYGHLNMSNIYGKIRTYE